MFNQSDSPIQRAIDVLEEVRRMIASISGTLEGDLKDAGQRVWIQLGEVDESRARIIFDPWDTSLRRAVEGVAGGAADAISEIRRAIASLQEAL